MQSKGAIRFVAILLALASLWQLSFTLVTNMQEKKAEKYAEAKVIAAEQSAAFEKVADMDKAFYLDSIRKVENRMYIDSISSEKIYFGYTYKDVKAKAINLGLDLKGGMNVMLQVQLEDLVKALADNNQTAEFQNAIALAKKNSVDSRQDFITLFAEAWKETSNGMPLAQVFGTFDMVGKIGPESTDAEVIEVIRAEAESAIANSFNVLRNRIDRFGVTQPNIQKLGNSGRILVELPGVKEPERVRKLLQGTASLEFWPTYDNTELQGFLQEANAFLASLEAEEAKIALMAFCDAHNAKERAEAFYRIATMKLYEVLKDEEGNTCKSFKAYVNDFRGGEVYGVKYAMAMHYINLCKYVYPQRACFEDYGTHLLINLIKPLKNEATRGTILEAIDANILNENMTSKEFKEAVNSILGEATEAEAEVSNEVEAEVRGNGYEASNTCEVSDEAIDKAVDIMEAFLECNAHDSEVTSAWFTILKALDR